MFIDANKIKQNVSFQSIIQFYQLELSTQNHIQFHGKCPIHQGNNPNAFHVNTEKNVFHCFSCCGGGNVIDFVMMMEKLDFYNALLFIKNKFDSSSQPQSLSFRLDLDFHHSYLKKRKIGSKTAELFQAGFCSTGMMKNRIAFPIFDINNNLVAYCGRATDNLSNPKYLFPRQFKKSHHLFNLNKVKNQSLIVIVEGFFDVLRLAIFNIPAVALMGAKISPLQTKLLADINQSYILMLDGDSTGRKMTRENERILKLNNIQFKSIRLPEGIQPDHMNYQQAWQYFSI